MTEKEKLKEIIETALGFHDYYKVVVTEKDIDRLVDKLIENGYCDVEKWKVLSNDLSHTIKVADRALKTVMKEYCRCDKLGACEECAKREKGCIEELCKQYKEQAERKIAEEEKK